MSNNAKCHPRRTREGSGPVVVGRRSFAITLRMTLGSRSCRYFAAGGCGAVGAGAVGAGAGAGAAPGCDCDGAASGAGAGAAPGCDGAGADSGAGAGAPTPGGSGAPPAPAGRKISMMLFALIALVGAVKANF